MTSPSVEQGVLAARPPMGWATWDCYGAMAGEEELKANAEYMAEHLARFGWEYILLDINWYEPQARTVSLPERPEPVMDAYGRLVPTTDRFPSASDGRGFKPLTDYLHNKGLKFGIHIMRGIPRAAVEQNLPILGTSYRADDIADKQNACFWCNNMWGIDMSRPGAQEYYDSIAALYAEWGVDYIKADDMSWPYRAEEIAGLSKAVRKCGRPIVLSLSPGPAPLERAEHLKARCQLWRISSDMLDYWDYAPEQRASLKGVFELCRKWAPHIGPGHWPDADMLPLGHICLQSQEGPERQTRLTNDEQRTMITLWCIARSPLMFGGVLLDIDTFTLGLLTNEKVIAVNQNSAANHELFHRGEHIAWAAEVPETQDKYLAVFNIADDGTAVVKVTFEELGLSGACSVRDLWEKQDVGAFESKFTPTVQAHGAGLYRISPQ